MEREMLRKELHEAVNNGDDVLLEKMYEIVKDYEDIPEERMKLILQERQNYLNGEGRSYSWEEAKEIVRGNKKSL